LRVKSARLVVAPYRLASASPNSFRFPNVADDERWYCAVAGLVHIVLSSAAVIIRLSVSVVGMLGPALVSELKFHAPPLSVCALSYQ
jgi:hypothetical protein